MVIIGAAGNQADDQPDKAYHDPYAEAYGHKHQHNNDADMRSGGRRAIRDNGEIKGKDGEQRHYCREAEDARYQVHRLAQYMTVVHNQYYMADDGDYQRRCKNGEPAGDIGRKEGAF